MEIFFATKSEELARSFKFWQLPFYKFSNICGNPTPGAFNGGKVGSGGPGQMQPMVSLKNTSYSDWPELVVL
jgi:hypothetical protein